MRNFLDDSIVEHKSIPPLRWIANWSGTLASRGLLDISYMQDEGKEDTFRYKLNGWLWDTFWPIYEKYGSTYRLSMDLSGKNWDDYDENGVPYWEKTGTLDPDYIEPFTWDYEDDNGDAFRLIRKMP